MANNPRFVTDSLYEQMRNECIEEAENWADSAVAPGPDYNNRWNRAYLAEMDRLCIERGIK